MVKPRNNNLKTGLRRTSTTEHDLTDPLSRVLAPPENETQEEMEIRLSEERAAAQVSQDIDRELRLEAQSARRRKCVKILLLGQSESGKSTVLKNFQRKYDPSAFDRERLVWRSVCQLNVVRSFNIILDTLQRLIDAQDASARHHQQPPTPPTSPGPDDNNNGATTPHHHHRRSHVPGLPPPQRLTAQHRRLMMRLAPLREIETALTRRFRPSGSGPLSPPMSPTTQAAPELCVGGYAWQRVRSGGAGGDGGAAAAAAGASADAEDEELGRVLGACQEDMVALWEDKVVREILDEQRIGLEELSGFFLNDLARIAVPHYAPTDDDVLRARLKTLGVTEHRFTLRDHQRHFIDGEGLSTAEFRIYDVGGSRNQRQKWIPYFEDINAIIFLAPISAFDQTLLEDSHVNRLEDTFMLWRKICASKLLSKVSLVLLLNKRDVLQRKLEAGVQFGRYVKSYTGRNDLESVAKYLKSKFKAVQRELSPVQRMFYSHITCATDTKQMSMILAAIEDLVLRRNLEEINLL